VDASANKELECTCTIVPPRHRGLITGSTHGKYAIYLDVFDDDSEIDPECPFHGENGTMVSKVLIRRPPICDRVTVAFSCEPIADSKRQDPQASKEG
jgi:hypothetical protein